jgi:hypothetical protein
MSMGKGNAPSFPVRFAVAFAAFAPMIGCTALAPPRVPDASRSDEAVVVDIDGTLTPSVYAIGEARPDAAKALQAYAARGVSIIYLSARVPILQSVIPPWLRAEGFPPGSLQLAQTIEDRRTPDAFKLRVMRDYKAHGWTIIAAYGDSATDFKAYAEAGIAPEQVYAMRRHGDSHCQHGQWAACLNGWTEQLGLIQGSQR